MGSSVGATSLVVNSVGSDSSAETSLGAASSVGSSVGAASSVGSSVGPPPQWALLQGLPLQWEPQQGTALQWAPCWGPAGSSWDSCPGLSFQGPLLRCTTFQDGIVRGGHIWLNHPSQSSTHLNSRCGQPDISGLDFSTQYCRACA